MTPWEAVVIFAATVAGLMASVGLCMIGWLAWQDWRLTRRYGSKAIDDVQRMLDAELIDEPREDRK